MKKRTMSVLFELLKNSRRSDREIAKVLRVSQPTVTRIRQKLEKDFVAGYTAIPKWNKVGFKIFVFTFIKSKVKYANPKERKAAVQKAREWFMKQPNVVFAVGGEGMGWDGLAISIHKSYSDYVEFKRKHDSALGDVVDESQTFIADADPGIIIKSFHFKYLADVE